MDIIINDNSKYCYLNLLYLRLQFCGQFNCNDDCNDSDSRDICDISYRKSRQANDNTDVLDKINERGT